MESEIVELVLSQIIKDVTKTSSLSPAVSLVMDSMVQGEIVWYWIPNIADMDAQSHA